MKNTMILPLALAVSAFAFPQPAPRPAGGAAFEDAEELFRLNRPEEAIPLFEEIIGGGSADPRAWVYLGVAYYQTGDYERAVEVCVDGLSKPETDRTALAYNAGNAAYLMENYARADACYAIAMKEDPSYAPAVLNRANAQLKLDNVSEAKGNYELYLELKPDAPQREQIMLMIQELGREVRLRESLRPELVMLDDFSDPRPAAGEDGGDGQGLEKIDVAILSLLTDDDETPPAPPEERVHGEEAPALLVTERTEPGERLSAESTPPDLPPEPERTASGEKLSAADAAAPELEGGSPADGGALRELYRPLPKKNGDSSMGVTAGSEESASP